VNRCIRISYIASRGLNEYNRMTVLYGRDRTERTDGDADVRAPGKEHVLCDRPRGVKYYCVQRVMSCPYKKIICHNISFQ
jgi:hypothetical protein